MKYIQVQDNQTNRIVIGTDYSIATFNIGFGAYSQGFSFFMDEGLMESGESTKGEYSRAYNKEEVENNTKGAISLVQNQALSDFYFFQELWCGQIQCTAFLCPCRRYISFDGLYAQCSIL